MQASREQTISVPVVEAVTLADVSQHWREYYRHAISAALVHSYQASDTVDNVLDALADGRAQVIDIMIGGERHAIGLIEVVTTKNGDYTNIWAVSGIDLALWKDDFLEYVERWARMMGHRGVMLGGRKGWARELAPNGYKTKAVILSKEFIQ